VRQTVVQQVGLVMCQGCCCGRERPDLLRDFCAARPDTVRLQVTGCLDRCDYADVVVVRPSPEGRRHGGRPIWFGFTDEYAADRLRDWIDAGGPGLADMPADLALHEISRPGATRSGHRQ
jgi:(2Fe-2S) ferredoxin